MIRTSLQAGEILDRLEQAARRGKLAGFTKGGRGGLFSVETHGHPYDGDLIASANFGRPDDGRITFQFRLRRKMPVIFAIVLLATIWPGVYFMDQLIPGEWGLIRTEWWYLPLTILPIPWMWRTLMHRSMTSNRTMAGEAIAKVAAAVEGTVEPAPSTGGGQATPR
jgi:hypothetical protein